MKTENNSPYGWWVATLIERFEYDDENITDLNRECKMWSNVVMFKAKDREAAYTKAIEYGNLGKTEQSEFIDEETGRTGKYIFEGIASLLPVYDPIDEDGTEILFDEEYASVDAVKSRVKKKEELEVFKKV